MTQTAASIDPAEIERFSALAAEWWDPQGKFRPLHKFNPVRLGFLRDRIAAHFGRDAASGSPLAGLRLLDIGCGGGLVSEPMARLGAAVTGADAGERNVGIARQHAEETGVEIDYRCTSAEQLASAGEQFDDSTRDLQQVIPRHGSTLLVGRHTPAAASRLTTAASNGFALLAALAIAGLFVVLAALQIFQQPFFDDQLLEDAESGVHAAITDVDSQRRVRPRPPWRLLPRLSIEE